MTDNVVFAALTFSGFRFVKNGVVLSVVLLNYDFLRKIFTISRHQTTAVDIIIIVINLHSLNYSSLVFTSFSTMINFCTNLIVLLAKDIETF